MKDVIVYHFADLHLSETTMPQTKPALDEIVGMVQNDKPDLVVFAGDMIVKRGSITPTEDDILKSAFMAMADICPTVCISGNHDISNRYDRVDAVTGILSRIIDGKRSQLHPNLHVRNNLDIFEIALNDEKRIRVVTMPFASKYNFLAKNDSINGNLNDVLTDTLAQSLVGINLKLHAVDDTPTIMVGHGTISGGVTDSEMMMTTEMDIAISRDQLPDNIVAYMWGHLHKDQTVGISTDRPVVYSGSPAPMTFGQTALKPSITKWTVNKGTATYERLPLKVAHQLLNINIDSEAFKNGQMPMEVIKNILGGYEVQDAKVKLRYKSPKEKASLIIQRELSEHIYSMGAFECKIVAETEDDIRVRIDDLDKDMSMKSLLKAWAELDPDRKKHANELLKLADGIDQAIPDEDIYRLQGTDYTITRLVVKNYKPLINVDLDFNQVGNITCIAGDNHNGKSQLAEAERFALWRILRRGTNLSDVVRHGADKSEVSVYFTSGGKDYRIDRSVALTKRSAKGDIVFSVKNDAGEYQALNEGTASETQTAIEKIVGTYAMYHATRFGSQDEIDLLCQMTPSELKDTLQEAINIGIYDLRKEIVKNMANVKQQSNQSTLSRIAQIEEATANEEDYKQNLQTEKINRERIDEEMESVNNELTGVKAEYTESQQAKTKLDTVQSEYVQTKAEIDRLEQSINRLRKIIENKDLIDEGLKRLEKLKKQLEVAREKEIQIQQSQTKYHQQQSVLTDEVRNCEFQVNKLQNEIKLIEEDINSAINRYDNETSQLKRHIERLSATAKLTETVPCSDLDINSTCDLLSTARQAKIEAEELKTRLEQLIQPDIADKEREIKEKVFASETLKNQIEDINQKQATLVQSKQDELASISKSNINAIRGELENENLRNWIGLKEELLVAQERISAQESEKIKHSQLCTHLEAETQKLTTMSMRYNELWQKVNTLDGQIRDLTRKRDVSTENIGRLQQKLDDIELLKAEQKQLQADIKHTQHEIELYNLLTNAFGRDGIPYLMLERTLPRFEQYANEFLCVDEGFPNATRVKISSTKEIQSGDERNEVVINFTDDRGEHPLGESSGWQKVAIGYALRASLAKVQAMATGTVINHTIFDEGWGKCDQTNILMGKRMITKFGQEFGKFFYISHIDTLKDIADTTINVIAVEGGADIAIA